MFELMVNARSVVRRHGDPASVLLRRLLASVCDFELINPILASSASSLLLSSFVRLNHAIVVTLFDTSYPEVHDISWAIWDHGVVSVSKCSYGGSNVLIKLLFVKYGDGDASEIELRLGCSLGRAIARSRRH